MSIVVKLSYEEQIINALNGVKHKKTDNWLTRSQREFDTIRSVLQPLYDKNTAAIERAQKAEREVGFVMTERDALLEFARNVRRLLSAGNTAAYDLRGDIEAELRDVLTLIQ